MEAFSLYSVMNVYKLTLYSVERDFNVLSNANGTPQTVSNSRLFSIPYEAPTG
jgi:hypothetical protein